MRKPSDYSVYWTGYNAAIEDAAKALHLTRAQAQLMAGEMTLGEWRTVSAILTNRQTVIRAKSTTAGAAEGMDG